MLSRLSDCLLIAATLTGSAQVQSPDKPDFSGSWILQSESKEPSVPRALSISQTFVRRNVRGEPMQPSFSEIRITRSFDDGVRSETSQIGIVSGSVAGVANTAGAGARSTT